MTALGPDLANGIGSRLQPGSFITFFYWEIDVRDRQRLLEVVAKITPDAIVHAAAQPSHDLAASRPFGDFDVNALGTLNLLEAARRASRNHRLF
jgi:CDP-paratose 2-epimerase